MKNCCGIVVVFLLWHIYSGIVVVEDLLWNRLLCSCCGICVVEYLLWNLLVSNLRCGMFCCGIFVVESSLLNKCCGIVVVFLLWSRLLWNALL